MPKKKTSKNVTKNIKDTIINRPNKKKQKILYYPTGSELLDVLVGGGEGLGYPAGRVINLVGDKSSGKTFLACELIAAARHKYKSKLIWQYDDCESGFSFNTENMYGFEIMPSTIEDRHRSRTVEDLYCNIRKFLENVEDGKMPIYVVDSLDGLDSKEGKIIANERYKAFEDGKEYDKGSYRMGKAKYLSSEFFPNIVELADKKKALIIIISQVRANLDPRSFEKFTRAGGKALDFYCHTVLWLANVSKTKRKNRSVGITVKAKNNKSKTPRPYRECFLQILFDYGIDNIATNIDFLFDLLTPTGMLSKEKRITWGDINDATVHQLKDFLVENKKEEWYRKNIHPTIKKSEFLEWVKLPEQKKFLTKLEDRYCALFKRNDLIEYIIDTNLEESLKNKTIQKWEDIEESIKTHRPRKY